LNNKRETDFGFSSVENARFAFPAPVTKPVSKIVWVLQLHRSG
jgi:hypothetical protein